MQRHKRGAFEDYAQVMVLMVVLFFLFFFFSLFVDKQTGSKQQVSAEQLLLAQANQLLLSYSQHPYFTESFGSIAIVEGINYYLESGDEKQLKELRRATESFFDYTVFTSGERTYRIEIEKGDRLINLQPRNLGLMDSTEDYVAEEEEIASLEIPSYRDKDPITLILYTMLIEE